MRKFSWRGKSDTWSYLNEDESQIERLQAHRNYHDSSFFNIVVFKGRRREKRIQQDQIPEKNMMKIVKKKTRGRSKMLIDGWKDNHSRVTSS